MRVVSSPGLSNDRNRSQPSHGPAEWFRKNRRDDVREVFEHPYRIMYRVRDEGIDVIAVVHEARKPR